MHDITDLSTYNYFSELKIFEVYKAEVPVQMSIKDILHCDERSVSKMVFIHVPEYHKSDTFFTIKIHQLDNNREVMISIIDATDYIMRNEEKSHNELLKTINATVNHELRNPLNSIAACNFQQDQIYQKIELLLENDDIDFKDKQKQLFEMLEELKKDNEVQKSSTKLTQFLIQDLLDYSQINQNKFRENIQQFDL